MRKDIVAIADKLIPKPTSIQRKQDQYVTDDIINEVLLKFIDTRDQLKQFAPYLKGDTVRQTCYNVWAFWRKNIRYIADDARNGKQIVKSPAAVWEDKFCDCKSFSVAVAACLHHLGISNVFRFVSFNPGLPTIPTHVYNVAKYQGNEIIIDCCLPQFDMQKPYAKKYDYLEPGLYSVTGVSDAEIGRGRFFKRITQRLRDKKRKRGELRLENVQTDAELGLVIHEQRLELEQDLAAKVHGIGSIADNCYQVELAAVNNAICEIGNPALAAERTPIVIKPATEFIGQPLHRIAGKKKAAKSQKKQQKKAKKEQKKTQKAIKRNEAGKGINKKDAKRLEKLNITVKKKKEGILKKVAKVITAPVRLVKKGILEATLPKSAPAFLYLFLSDAVLVKAPAIVQQKHGKAKVYADKVVNKVGMKRDHFMGILRNGIMQNMGDTPENILKQWMQDSGFKIGFVSEAISTAFGMLGNLLGGKAAQLMADAPDPSDWGTVSATVKEDIVQQQASDAATTDPTAGGGVVPYLPEDTMYNQGGGYNYSPVPIPTGNNTFGNYSGGNIKPLPETPTADEKEESEEVENKYGEEGKTLDEVVLPPGKKQSGDNTLMYAGLGLLAVAALSSGGKGRKRK